MLYLFFTFFCQTVKLHNFVNGDRPPEMCTPGVPLAIFFGGMACGSLLSLCGLHGTAGLVHSLQNIYVRRRLVREFDLDESEACSFVTGFCCACCSSIQMAEHLCKVPPSFLYWLFCSKCL